MNAGCKENKYFLGRKEKYLMRRRKHFYEKTYICNEHRKNETAAGYDSGLRSRAIVIDADVFFDYANHFLIRGAEINIHTATETANTASLPFSLFLLVFS